MAAVQLLDRMQQRHDMQIKLLATAKAEYKTLQQVQALTDAEFKRYQKQTLKLQRALKRNKTLVWVLAGYGAAATAVAAVFIAAN